MLMRYCIARFCLAHRARHWRSVRLVTGVICMACHWRSVQYMAYVIGFGSEMTVNAMAASWLNAVAPSCSVLADALWHTVANDPWWHRSLSLTPPSSSFVAGNCGRVTGQPRGGGTPRHTPLVVVRTTFRALDGPYCYSSAQRHLCGVSIAFEVGTARRCIQRHDARLLLSVRCACLFDRKHASTKAITRS